MLFRRTGELPQLAAVRRNERQKALDTNRNILPHQSFGCLLYGTEVIAFASVDRGASSLVEDIPTLALEVLGHDGLSRVFLYAKIHILSSFLVVNTPVFAYEPILRRLQEKMEFPMADILFATEPRQESLELGTKLTAVINHIPMSQGQNLQGIINSTQKVSLDSSQMTSLLDGLQQRISVIQGPPGKFQGAKS